MFLKVPTNPNQGLIPPLVCMTIIALTGIFGNSCIVLATFKKKSLHHTCNILIAIASFLDIIVELHAPLGLFFASFYFNSLFMSVRLCWYINMMLEFSSNAGLILVLIIGIDRMLSIVAPMAYRNIGRFKYLCAVLSVPIAVFLLWAILSYTQMVEEEKANTVILCAPPAFYRGYTLNAHNYFNVGVSIVILVLYATIWLIFKRTKKVSSATKKILKSLTVITVIIASTYPTTKIILMLSGILMSPEMFTKFFPYPVCLIEIGYAANFFVYLIFSTEYRAAFQDIFSFLPGVKKSSANIGPLRIKNSSVNDGNTTRVNPSSNKSTIIRTNRVK